MRPGQVLKLLPHDQLYRGLRTPGERSPGLRDQSSSLLRQLPGAHRTHGLVGRAEREPQSQPWQGTGPARDHVLPDGCLACLRNEGKSVWTRSSVWCEFKKKKKKKKE